MATNGSAAAPSACDQATFEEDAHHAAVIMWGVSGFFVLYGWVRRFGVFEVGATGCEVAMCCKPIAYLATGEGTCESCVRWPMFRFAAPMSQKQPMVAFLVVITVEAVLFAIVFASWVAAFACFGTSCVDADCPAFKDAAILWTVGLCVSFVVVFLCRFFNYCNGYAHLDENDTRFYRLRMRCLGCLNTSADKQHDDSSSEEIASRLPFLRLAPSARMQVAP